MPKQLSVAPPLSPTPALSRPTERVNSPPKPPSPVRSPLQPVANAEPVHWSHHEADSRVGTLQTTHNAPPSPAREYPSAEGDMTSGCAGHTSLRTHLERSHLHSRKMSLIARWTWRVRHLHHLLGCPSYLGASCDSDGGEARTFT
ncbi:hypothetical protein FIBSPDRAFT_508063 [Athelia psychrophila]|uniref:Uncharacterized protein n=1 Tax=Athelia psychrophila TaxID=1759441 RepID=A0A166JVQ1_9AGAM|nr:hypothetical protein FIBSPDRAFT_508063 [Fibularhizoctonia sp. CBS 109695]